VHIFYNKNWLLSRSCVKGFFIFNYRELHLYYDIQEMFIRKVILAQGGFFQRNKGNIGNRARKKELYRL